jgi:hypothetical protein
MITSSPFACNSVASGEDLMTIERWNPSVATTKQEEFLLKRLTRTKKLFGFLRRHRHELLDAAFQDELAAMYRDTGAGADPVNPALMAMAVLLQGYAGASDAEAVELTVVDLRWQMVLGQLGATTPAFSQGALQDFRQRLIRTEMDRRLLERTVELARQTNEFDWRKLPGAVRVAMDSSPLLGAGRVEDTINLLAHAAREVVVCIARLVSRSEEEICREAGIPLLLESSAKKALDRNWGEPHETEQAVKELARQIGNLERWVTRELPAAMKKPPLKKELETLRQLMAQDLEPDPEGGGPRIHEGVAPDRRVSVRDPEMRHGRKTKSKRFHGYKRHIASDLDLGVITACAITPANRPEEEAAIPLKSDIEHQHLSIRELYIDRGYINSPAVAEILAQGGDVICRPWVARNGDLFPKSYFGINMRDRTITCPIGVVEPFVEGSVVEFDPARCDACFLRQLCTSAAMGRGRTVTIADNERLQQRLRKRYATRTGRQRLRERVAVEHKLAHISQRQGNRARYIGARKNLFDLRRASAIQNLEVVHMTTESVKLRKAA